MTDWQIALTVVGSVLGYGFFAGVTRAVAPDDVDRHLNACFWPLALPAHLGMLAVRWARRPRLPKARQVKP